MKVSSFLLAGMVKPGKLTKDYTDLDIIVGVMLSIEMPDLGPKYSEIESTWRI